MFKNPGEKLKGIAKVIFWILLVIYILAGVAVMMGMSVGESNSLEGPAAIVAGALIIVVGFLLSWLSSIAIYAVGSAVDDIQTIKRIQIDLHRKNEGA